VRPQGNVSTDRKTMELVSAHSTIIVANNGYRIRSRLSGPAVLRPTKAPQ
jgi:hypothetical protein